MNAPINRDNPPRNGRGYWVYVDPETKEVFEHPYYQQVQMAAKKHRLANGLPIGAQWQSLFDENLCSNTQGDVCTEQVPNKPMSMLEKATRLIVAMAQWAKSGFRIVSQEKFEERHDICNLCDFWGGDGAFFGTGRCAKCGCSGLKLYVASERCPIGKWERL